MKKILMRPHSLTGVLLCIFLLSGTFLQAQQYYNVMDYGAVNDGSQKITQAIAKAIESAAATGGGTIYFPAGEYLTGPIHFKSNITLFIDAGATLKFSDNFDDYLPMVPSRWEGTDVINFSPLIYAYKVENIAIRGRGTIDGQGKKWWDFHHKLYDKNTPRTKWQEEFARLNKDVIMPDQPGMIERGFLRPPFIQPMYSKNILIEGITIKSGRDTGGRKMGMPAENYTITNCTMLSGHGGVVIGSEMSGGVKKITISNCVFDGTDRGIRIKSMRGRGGTVEEIRVDNVIMKNIKEQAFMLNMYYQKTPPEPVSERTPQFKNIHFSNITAEVEEAGFLLGLEEMPIEGITFHDINIIAHKGFTIKDAKNIEFHNVQVSTAEGSSIRAENVNYMEIDGVKTMSPHPETPVIALTNVENAFLHGSFPVPGTDVFLKLQGAQSKFITLDGNNFLHVKTPVLKGEEVLESSVNGK